MGDFVLREIFTSGTRAMQNAIFLLSQPNTNTIAITISAVTTMINVLNQANAIIRVITGKLANDNDRRKIKAAITEICNLFTLKKETIFTCTNEYSNTYICIYTFILTKK